MALSPWFVTPVLRGSEAGAILAGYAEVNPHTDGWFKVDLALIGTWCERMLDAAIRSELEIRDIYAASDGVITHGPLEGRALDRAVTLDEVIEENLRTVIFSIERRELYRWLNSQGIPDESIPPAIRVGLEEPKGTQALECKPTTLNPKRKNTYLRLIKALMLEALGGDIPEQPYKAAASVQAILDKHGLSMKEDTVVSVIKEIKDL
ncbi:hypothetical protein [Billgrantia sp. C5P2]|uniref:hypothetical protein n=1 Tax=Billgrantia sp. C5P2 TaxID=3436239 RepID=UPI003DA37809